MSFNLYQAAKGYLLGGAVSSAAGVLGAPEGSVQKAVDVALPLSILGITQSVENGQSDSVLNMAQEAFNSGALNNVGQLFHRDGFKGASSMVSHVFGDHMGHVTQEVASYSGLNREAVVSVFSAVVPLILGVLGKHAREHNVMHDGLVPLLASEKNSVLSALPPGMSIMGLLPPAEHYKSHHHHHHHHAPVPEKKKSNIAVRLAVILGSILLLFLILRGCMNKKTEEVAVTTDTTTMVSTVQPTTPARESIKVTLPNGVVLDAYKGGIEDMLVQFLNGSEPAGKDKWFDFRDLNFKFGTAEIVPESRNEVDNIIKILQAYPKVKVKIGGYTDKVGDEAANKKLSKERADAVTQILKTAGVGAQVTDAEGYGSDFAKYPASAPESDRIKDRRVAVGVREK
jgi:outer membrane protein OmpA-like peptidoglycan-associated protein/gas vesicle protein